MNRTRLPHQRQQQHRQGWFDFHGRPPLQQPQPPHHPQPPQPPLPSPQRRQGWLNIHGRPLQQPQPPQHSQPPQSPLLSPRPQSNSNVNVHHHHHHHHLQTPPSPSPWQAPLTSPYNQYYHSSHHSLLPPFPVLHYPSYNYENYYGGGLNCPNYDYESFYGGAAAMTTTTSTAAAATSAQGALIHSDDHQSTTSVEGAKGSDSALPSQLGQHPYTRPNWRPKSNEELRDFIRYQIEFYFSMENLENDWYLKKNMDKEGWVDVDLIASFPRIVSKCADIDLILESLKPSLVVEVQGNKMRRRDGLINTD